MTHKSKLRSLLLFPLFTVLLTVPFTASLPLAAQAPQVRSDTFGFSFSLPDDWQMIVPKSQAGQQRRTPQGTAEEIKKGMACLQVPMTARHGEPASVIVVDVLPFDCLGQTMAAQDLPEFGAGIAAGLKTILDFLSPVTASYALAGHKLWIERVKAVPKGKTAPVSTIEITCTILEKGAICWMVNAADETGLQAFETAPVTLEGSPIHRLVPAQVFTSTPAPAINPRSY